MTNSASLDIEEIVMADFFLSELYDSDEDEGYPSGFLFFPIVYPTPPATFLSMN